MATIQWDSSLSVGVDVIDEQHRQWIDRYNAVVEALASPQGASRLPQILDFLIDYTHQHFTDEETAMATCGYPGFEAHKAKHDELKQTLADLVRDYEEEGATHVLANATDTFLGNWLLQHIENVDKEFGAFVKALG